MSEAVLIEVRSLQALGLEDLRAVWRRRFGAPPKLRSPELLRLLLAWKIQQAAYGGLDQTTRLALRQKGKPAPRWADGVKIVREWKGVIHEVVVEGGAFVHDGVRYKSLSSIARQITGVQWNGPRFFGLRSETAQ